MGHNHSVNDTDTRFIIDPITRAIKNESLKKAAVVQYDHNSERLTFECGRYIEGHDMSKCNRTEVHYLNTGTNKTKPKAGVYEVDDLQICPEDEEKVVCSWLISQNATQNVGELHFLIRFSCTDDDGNTVFAWNTAICKAVSVAEGISGAVSVVTQYADILAQWKAELYNAGYINASAMQRAIDVERARIDNFIASNGGNPIDGAEVQDLRVSQNGTIFPTAGTASRTQFEQLFSALNHAYIENVYNAEVQTAETITDNAYIQSGELKSNGNYFVTGPIDVSRFVGRHLYFNVSLHGSATESAVVSCFDADGNFLTEKGIDGLRYTVPLNASYIRLTVYKYSFWDIDDVNSVFMILTSDANTEFFPYGVKSLLHKTPRKMAVDVRDNTINITAPSGTRCLHYTLRHFTGSKNGFFDFASICETEEFSAIPVNETTVFSNGSDFFGPFIVKAIENADGDMPESMNFTGASHAYSGNTDGTTAATGRSVLRSILIDGTRRDEFSGHCDTVDVYWTNYIQATNTKKSDGTGREVLKENYHLHFDGVSFEVENDIEALEAVEIVRYYGLQVAQGVPGYSYDVSYVGSHNNVVSANGNSKSTDTNCREIHIMRKDKPVECRFGVHPVGLGAFYRNNAYSAFDTDYGKTYFFLINPDTSCEMIKDQQVNFKGYYKFRYCE